MKLGAKKRPAVFLDRDGTIIDETGYLDDPGRIRFYPGAVGALKRLKAAGYLLVVATNQSGVGRGFFDEETAAAVNLAMVNALAGQGVQVDAVYFCPHHPEEGCDCRKPGTLMARRAVTDLGIERDASWMVGDTARDVVMGRQYGLGVILVETGMEDKGDVPGDVSRYPALPDAIDRILGERA